MQRVIAIIPAGPAGAGKDTLMERLKARFAEDAQLPRLYPACTATTRPPRSSDPPGKYLNVSPQEFDAKFERGELLERNLVHGYLYGKVRESFDTLPDGHLILTDLDYQGIGDSLPKLLTAERTVRIPYLFIDEETLIKRVHFRCERDGDPVNQEDLEERLVSLRKENAWADIMHKDYPSEVFHVIDARLTADEVGKVAEAYCLANLRT